MGFINLLVYDEIQGGKRLYLFLNQLKFNLYCLTAIYRLYQNSIIYQFSLNLLHMNNELDHLSSSLIIYVGPD